MPSPRVIGCVIRCQGYLWLLPTYSTLISTLYSYLRSLRHKFYYSVLLVFCIRLRCTCNFYTLQGIPALPRIGECSGRQPEPYTQCETCGISSPVGSLTKVPLLKQRQVCYVHWKRYVDPAYSGPTSASTMLCKLESIFPTRASLRSSSFTV